MTTLDQAEATLTAADALKVIVSATGDAACPVHEVGPVANHVVGPTSALRPYGHPEAAEQMSASHRSKWAVDRLIYDAIRPRDEIVCTCGGEFRHPLTVTIQPISEGALVRAHPNDIDTSRGVAKAVGSADVDLLNWHVEPRLWALTALVDRARAEHGGTLPEPVPKAMKVLAHSLAGHTRWNVVQGYHDGWKWSPPFRPTDVTHRCDEFMKHPEVRRAVMARLVRGR